VLHSGQPQGESAFAQLKYMRPRIVLTSAGIRLP
jgi:hypothetical protein